MYDGHAVSAQPHVKLNAIDPERARGPECCDRVARSAICDTAMGDDREIMGTTRTLNRHRRRLTAMSVVASVIPAL
jgi:hypothetical protein